MGIRCACPNGHTLNVKAELAGKRGICPKCQAKFQVPLAGETASAAAAAKQPSRVASSPKPAARQAAAGQSNAPQPSPTAQTQAPQAQDSQPQAGESATPTTRGPVASEPVWYVRPAGAAQSYGPAGEAILRQWVDEGRVAADTYVWRSGWPAWRRASEVPEHFPQLAAGVPPTGPGASPPEYNTTAAAESGQPPSAPTGTADPASDVSLAAARYQRRRQRAQRMQLIAAVMLLILVLVLTGVLVMVMQSTPGGDTSANETPTSPAPAPADQAADGSPPGDNTGDDTDTPQPPRDDPEGTDDSASGE